MRGRVYKRSRGAVVFGALPRQADPVAVAISFTLDLSEAVTRRVEHIMQGKVEKPDKLYSVRSRCWKIRPLSPPATVAR